MNHDEKAFHHHPVIEFLHGQHKTAEELDHRWTQVELGIHGLRAVIGGRAFRSFHPLSGTFELNKAGNLRGIVVSARWRTLFRHTSDVGEYRTNVGYLATLVSGIAESAPKIESIVNSPNSPTLKGMEIAATASTIAQRALLGAVPEGAHLIYRSLEGWCMIAGLVGGKADSVASHCLSTLHNADTLVQTTFKTITDANNQAKAVWSVIDFVTSVRKQ
jgi:hypothetical protein